MSFQAMAWATEQKLPTREKFVLIMLANYAGNEQWDCHPSISTLADDTGMSRDTVIRAIKALEDASLVKIVRRNVDGINLPNIYRLIRAGGSSTVQGVVAVCDQGSSTVQGGVVAVCDSNQSLEPIIEPVEQRASAPQKDSGLIGPDEIKSEFPDLPEQLVRDFLRVRKAKKAPLTETSWRRIAKVLSEASEKGCTPSDALGLAVERGWQGLSLQWLSNAGLLTSNVKPIRKGLGPDGKLLPGYFWHEADIDLPVEKRRILSDETHDRASGYRWDYLRSRGLA
ncbi:helix-turn-helix domain-containing protein [Pseudomonas aeruginosa]|uniref:helix-turn-helix domain-containing protein n=1 Tax=Pseudomonas aeruginosa TaxID=287 RepID=UPI003CC64338